MTLTISKKADKDCKLVVETSQHLNLFPESVSKLVCNYICYHFLSFRISVISYTNQPGRKFSLTASILASNPHRINSPSDRCMNLWVFSVTQQVNAR